MIYPQLHKFKFGVSLMIALSFVIPLTASAQSDWPKGKPIKIVVGFAPASTTDIVSRVIANKLAEVNGASYVIENKPGAGGNIATGQVKRAPADGYTVLAWLMRLTRRFTRALAMMH
jgi:tripartite-type tricarboxylate transporter receptor subunit TctC